MTEHSSQIDLKVPRGVGQIVAAALRLYLQMPLLFMCLAGIIVIPYRIVDDLVTNARHASSATVLVLLLANVALVTPFIVAMQMQVLLDLGAGRRAAIPDVLARGLRALPMVAAAEIVASLIAFAGLVFFVFPGLLAAVRLAVAAPVAACEQVSWPEAIRRSFGLTRGSSWRVFGLILIEDALTYLVAAVTGAASPALVVIGILGAIIAQSFCMLLIGLLYFDLRAREAAPVASQ
ncbi:MAG: hypothetical protein ACRDLT_10170 [Solirubrobacteraceae bacterium]